MKEKLSVDEFNEIEYVVKCAIAAPNKKEAKVYIERLRWLTHNYYGRINTVLSKLIGSTDRATGKIAEKNRFEYYVNMDLSSLKSFIEE